MQRQTIMVLEDYGQTVRGHQEMFA